MKKSHRIALAIGLVAVIVGVLLGIFLPGGEEEQVAEVEKAQQVQPERGEPAETAPSTTEQAALTGEEGPPSEEAAGEGAEEVAAAAPGESEAPQAGAKSVVGKEAAPVAEEEKAPAQQGAEPAQVAEATPSEEGVAVTPEGAEVATPTPGEVGKETAGGAPEKPETPEVGAEPSAGEEAAAMAEGETAAGQPTPAPSKPSPSGEAGVSAPEVAEVAPAKPGEAAREELPEAKQPAEQEVARAEPEPAEGGAAVETVSPAKEKAAVEEPHRARVIEREVAPATAGEQAGGEGEIARPTFDVVRVAPEGDTVIAGRAEPGAEVVVKEDGREIGRAKADQRGEWVVLPETPLKGGDRQLSLTETLPSGEEVESEQVVVVSIPEKPAERQVATAEEGGEGEQAPLAVLSTRDGGGASRVLQAPAGEGQEGKAGVSLSSVDYDEKGEVTLAGKAEPGASVNVYVDDQYVGTAKAGDKGDWQLEPGEKLAPGTHRVRVDKIDRGGIVLARIETPLTRVEREQMLLGDALVIVQPGNSLWRIARRAYGGGVHFTVIYDANRSLIGDPNLIYPGQVFIVPPLN